MRRIALPALLCLLSACNNQPSFEERYSEAEATIAEQGQSIESDLQGKAQPAEER